MSRTLLLLEFVPTLEGNVPLAKVHWTEEYELESTLIDIKNSRECVDTDELNDIVDVYYADDEDRIDIYPIMDRE